jgi:hypothetical protein
MMVQQAAKNRFDRALSDPARPLARPTLLPVPGTAISRIKGRARKLLLGSGRHTTHFQRALLAVLIGHPVILNPVTILAGRVVAKGQQLARRAAKRIDLRLLRKAFCGWLIRPKNRNPRRNSLLFEEGVVKAIGIARIGYEASQRQVFVC